MTEKIQLQHGKKRFAMDRDKYEMVKNAILESLKEYKELTLRRDRKGFDVIG